MKWTRVWYVPILLSSLLIELGIFIIILYFLYLSHTTDPDLRSIAETIVGFLVTMIATIIGLLSPIIVPKNLERESQRRSMIFALSAVWSELRGVRSTLINIEKNFTFSATLNAPPQELNIDDKIAVIAEKVDSFSGVFNSLSRVAYDAMLNSGTISYLPSDEIYNTLCQTYEDIEDLCTMYTITRSGIILRSKSLEVLQRRQLSFVNTNFETPIKENIETSLQKLYAEVLFTQKKVTSSIEEIRSFISNFGPNLFEEDKDINYSEPLP